MCWVGVKPLNSKSLAFVATISSSNLFVTNSSVLDY